MRGEADRDLEALRAELVRLRAREATLRVAARHDDLLQRSAFEALAAALGAFIPLGRLVVVVPDGDEQIMYAASLGDSASPLPPFGARFPLPAPANRRTVMEGAVRICSDTRAGDAVDRLVAQSGYLSYAALPIRDLASDGAPIVAKLIACFSEVERAAQVPIELLEDTAELFGLGFRRALAAARERRLAMILETSGDAMLAWDSGGKISDGNAAASRMTGLPREQLLGRPISELVEGVAGAPPGLAFRTQLSARCADGSVARVPVSITVSQVWDDPVVAAHLLARDMSHVALAEREAAEHLGRLRALEHEHRTLLDNAPLVIFRLDPGSGKLRYVNRHAEVLLGITAEHARARPDCLRAAHADTAAARQFEQALERARLGLPHVPYEARLVKPSGEEITVQARLYALAEGQQVVAIEGILADVSAEHAARTQLVQTDRLSTLGRLAASVAHEINNPAAFLMLGLEHLGRLMNSPATELDADERVTGSRLIGQLTEALERITAIVRDLRLFAGPVRARPGSAPASADVRRALQSALTLTRSLLVERARLMIDLEPVPPASIDEGRLAQVLVNLLVNAAQAIPKGSGREHTIAIGARAVGTEVQIEVTDTGSGIAPGDLGRIWTPFFSTKAPEGGTGLGLSISRDIVERAGGHIDAVSPALEVAGVGSVGTRFSVRLKQASAGATAASGCAPRPAGPGCGPDAAARRRRLLIIEDDAAFGRALAVALAERHEVCLAGGGAHALELLRARSFDAIVCDVRMPEMSGEAVYANACALSAAYRGAFIFMTGLGFGADLERLQELHRCPVLEKPFPIERLLQALDQLG